MMSLENERFLQREVGDLFQSLSVLEQESFYSSFDHSMKLLSSITLIMEPFSQKNLLFVVVREELLDIVDIFVFRFAQDFGSKFFSLGKLLQRVRLVCSLL